MKYRVGISLAINAFGYKEVEAENEDEAAEKAKQIVDDNFLEFIDENVVNPKIEVGDILPVNKESAT